VRALVFLTTFSDLTPLCRKQSTGLVARREIVLESVAAEITGGERSRIDEWSSKRLLVLMENRVMPTVKTSAVENKRLSFMLRMSVQ